MATIHESEKQVEQEEQDYIYGVVPKNPSKIYDLGGMSREYKETKKAPSKKISGWFVLWSTKSPNKYYKYILIKIHKNQRHDQFFCENDQTCVKVMAEQPFYKLAYYMSSYMMQRLSKKDLAKLCLTYGIDLNIKEEQSK